MLISIEFFFLNLAKIYIYYSILAITCHYKIYKNMKILVKQKNNEYKKNVSKF